MTSPTPPTTTTPTVLSLSPLTSNVIAGQTVQLQANTAIANWQTSCGTIAASPSDNTVGIFTAPSSVPPGGTCTVTANAAANNTIQAVETILPLSLSPATTNTAAGQTQQFKANAVILDWQSSCGTIIPSSTDSTAAVFTAPSSPPSGGTCTITATAAGSATAMAVDTVAPLSLSPAKASTVTNQTQQFKANAAIISWHASCGTIAPSATDDTVGFFTAPSSIPSGGTCTIIGTASGDATAQAVDTVVTPLPSGTLFYTTWKNGNDATGQQPNEALLTPSNVNSTTFGLKFTDSVDGKVFAQPLYLSNISINGSTHNVVFVATEHDSVYAFDADQAGPPLWQTSFLVNGATTVATSSSGYTIQPEIGITGTPVIDISKGAQYGVLYVVAETLENGVFIHRLHALDVATGNDISGSPVVIAASGFTSSTQLQRPALILANGNVYIAFGSQGDNGVWHGWIFAYATNTLSQVAAWNATPTGLGAGIWGGGGLAADSAGNIYAATGNGNFDGTAQFGMSWVKLSPTLSVLDFFSPYNQSTLSAGDMDLGSGGPVLVPTQAGSAHPNELIGCGKPTPVYVVDRDHMGGFQSGSDSQIVQEIASIVGGGVAGQRQYTDHCFMTPAYFQGNLYFIGNNDVIKMFSLDPSTGLMSTTPASQGSFSFLFPGSQPVVSSNGANNGIVWALDYTSYYLHAYDASDMTNELYRSSSVGYTKWTVPTVINGKVYVVSTDTLSVFGLL